MNSTAAVIHVPFRCPDCGDGWKFETLKELRSHLQTEHADVYTIYGRREKNPPYPPLRFGHGSATPIMELYHADAIKIEEDLLKHKRNELNNKQRRYDTFSADRNSKNAVEFPRSTIRHVNSRPDFESASFRQYGHSSRVEQKYRNRSNEDKLSNIIDHEEARRILRGGKNLDDSFRDDESESLQDVTRPRSVTRHINKIRNIPSSETSVKKLSNASGSTDVKLPIPSVSPDMDSHVRETLTALSQEVLVSRASQHAAADSLIASQEVYSGLEHSAQEKISKQQEIIAMLALKLSEKDEKLTNLTFSVNNSKSLKNEDDVKSWIRNIYNEESEKALQEELFYKQKELISLSQMLQNAKTAVLKCEEEIKDKKNEELNLSTSEKDLLTKFSPTEKPERDTTKATTKDSPNVNYQPVGDTRKEKKERVSFQVSQAKVVERDMQAKEKELVSLRSKSMQLESDRQTLLLEMQALLEMAARDNDKLKAELAGQGKQLSKLNLELERSKQEQSELLGETNTLYFQADVSLSRLKHVLEERDSQLSSVTGQLEQAREMQERLTKERQEYLNTAMEKESKYQVLVQENDIQLKSMRESLDESQVEKEKLEENLRDLKEELDRKEKDDLQMEARMKEMESRLAGHETWQVGIKEQIKDKEGRLLKAKRSMDQMNKFMSDTAKQELDARSRLEQFISNLIDRSTQTESELKRLREAYAAKEETLKSLMEAQVALPSKENPYHSYIDEREKQYYPSWQQETQEQIQKLSSNPLPSLHTLQDMHGLNRPTSPLAPRRLSSRQSNVNEPSRSRSSINRVRKCDTMDTVPERHLKNRPLLVMGKEYPHASAYGFSKVQSPTAKPVEETMKQESGSRNKDQKRSMYEDKFYLPEESNDYSELWKESHYEGYKNPGVQRSQPNSSLFKNTPSVERMYQNVQKHSYSSNPANSLLTKTATNTTQGLYPKETGIRQLPMDEQGIIWEIYDRPAPKTRPAPKITRPVKKKMRRRSNPKMNKRDNRNRSSVRHGDPSDSEELAGSKNSDEDNDDADDADEDVPNLKKRDGQIKRSDYPSSQNPTPLGDKIALLLTSMAPGSLASSARKEYSKSISSIPGYEDFKPAQSSSECESPATSPLHNARAVQQRVEKLTQGKGSDRSWSPQPKARNRSKLSNPQTTAAVPSLSLAQSPQIAWNEREQRPEGIESNLKPVRDYTSLDSSRSFLLENAPLSQDGLHPQEAGHRYDTEPGIEDTIKAKTGSVHPLVEVTTDEVDNKAIEKDRKVLEGAPPQSRLLQPVCDYNEQLESHNAESDFSSSSYATLRNGLHGAPDDLDYTADTQDDEIDKPAENNNDIQVHAESEIKRTFDSASKEYSDNEEPLKSPSVWEMRDRFQNMSSKDSFVSSKSLDSKNRSSLQRQDSCVTSTDYDKVMKELILKHPYISRDLQGGNEEQENKSCVVEDGSRCAENRWDANEEGEETNRATTARCRDAESTDYGLMSSGEENEDKYPRRQAMPSGTMSRGETMDASTDTDLEKLAKPGNLPKPKGGKKKKKNSSWIRKENKNQKTTVKLRDVAKTHWTSIDDNDPEEREREERQMKRRVRVALFCALAYADTKALLSASQVCKDWRKISHHPSLWKNVELKDSPTSSEFLITLSKWCTQTQSLSLRDD